MLYAEDLECAVQCGCSNPACNHQDHDQMFFHAKCHPTSGMVLSYGNGNIVRLACGECGKQLWKIAAAETKPLKPTCHPDAGVWVSYRQHSGQVEVTCCECRQLVASLLVHYEGTQLDYQRSGKTKKTKQRRNRSNRKGPSTSECCTKPRCTTDNRMKVHVTFPHAKRGEPAGEFLWARRISPDTAKIDSIPYGTAKVARGDAVRFAANREITEVLEHAARTRGLIYADDEEQSPAEVQERFQEVCKELDKYDIEVEGMFPGICSISVPLDLDDEQLEILAYRLDCTVIYHEDEAE